MAGRRGAFTGVLIAFAVIFVAAVLPLPAYLIAPGTALDLSNAVVVGDRPAPRDRFFLTDVNLIRASPLRLLFALVPGVRLARIDTIVPRGVSDASFDDGMKAAMTQSQAIAAVVAERAAGYDVKLPAAVVRVQQINAGSLAGGRLAIGDVIRRINRRVIHGNDDVRSSVSGLLPGTLVRIAVDRDGRSRIVDVPTVAVGGRTRLGVFLEARYALPRLAVPVRYAVGDIGGSSGGLMMALRIYDALHRSAARAARTIAGTGTIALDGRIGPIEGTQQKLIAAKRAGARLFFVPRENYGDVASERDVRVIPVGTFGDAIRALDG